jgi:hypothetical protein
MRICARRFLRDLRHDSALGPLSDDLAANGAQKDRERDIDTLPTYATCEPAVPLSAQTTAKHILGDNERLFLILNAVLMIFTLSASPYIVRA